MSDWPEFAFVLNEEYPPLPHAFVQWKGTDVCMDVRGGKMSTLQTRSCPGLQMGPEAAHQTVHRGGCCQRWLLRQSDISTNSELLAIRMVLQRLLRDEPIPFSWSQEAWDGLRRIENQWRDTADLAAAPSQDDQ